MYTPIVINNISELPSLSTVPDGTLFLVLNYQSDDQIMRLYKYDESSLASISNDVVDGPNSIGRFIAINTFFGS